jgi:hypothetical protein
MQTLILGADELGEVAIDLALYAIPAPCRVWVRDDSTVERGHRAIAERMIMVRFAGIRVCIIEFISRNDVPVHHKVREKRVVDGRVLCIRRRNECKWRRRQNKAEQYCETCPDDSHRAG